MSLPVSQIDPKNLPGQGSAESRAAATPGPAHHQLESLVGSWKIRGHNRSNVPGTPDSEVKGEESYEWIPGNFFLLYRWDRRFNEGSHKGIGLIGYDDKTQKYFMNSADSMGFARVYDLEFEDHAWKITGPWERAMIKIGTGGQLMKIHWEFTQDGKKCQPLCDLLGQRMIS
jgi:hypothetical protein